jgi:hypothetical protein
MKFFDARLIMAVYSNFVYFRMTGRSHAPYTILS